MVFFSTLKSFLIFSGMVGEDDEEQQPWPNIDEAATEKQPSSSPQQTKHQRKRNRMSSSPATAALAARAAAATRVAESSSEDGLPPLPPSTSRQLAWLDDVGVASELVLASASASMSMSTSATLASMLALAASAAVPMPAAVRNMMTMINGQAYRKISVVLKEREEQGLIYTNDFPTSSYTTFADLAVAINTFHVAVTGYTVRRESKQPRSSRRGCTRMVQCNCAGKYVSKESDSSRPKQSTSKQGCPWKLWTEEVANEQGNVVWVVSRLHQAAVDYAKEQNLEYVHLCHNHAPHITHTERMIDPGN
jgi:hypothetical protein